MAVSPTHNGWRFDRGNTRLDKYYRGTRVGHINASGETVVGTFSTSGAFTVDAGGAAITGAVTSTGAITSSSASGGIGYATGAGGTVTQATSKSTGVTLSTVTGEITMNAASLAADTTVSFTLTNTAIAATDYILIQHVSAGTQASYIVTASAGAGSATVNVHNATPAALAEAIVLKFVVIKAVTA